MIPAFTPAKSLPIPSCSLLSSGSFETKHRGCNNLPKELLLSAPLLSESDHHYMQCRKMIKKGYRIRNAVLKCWPSSKHHHVKMFLKAGRNDFEGFILISFKTRGPEHGFVHGWSPASLPPIGPVGRPQCMS